MLDTLFPVVAGLTGVALGSFFGTGIKDELAAVESRIVSAFKAEIAKVTGAGAKAAPVVATDADKIVDGL